MSFNVPLKRNPNRGNRMLGAYPLGDAPVLDNIPYTSYVIDSFEYEDIPVSRPSQTPPGGDLWRNNQTDTDGVDRPATLATTLEEVLYGTRSMRLERLFGQSPQAFQLFLYNNFGGATNDWQNVSDRAVGWQFNVVNRMRTWFKAPPQMTQSSNVANSNFHVGTYLRDSNEPKTEQETGNGHWYHYYNIGYEGEMWHQILVDSHPSHHRGASGNVEHPNITEPYPSVDPGRTYFDMMTYFYYHHKNVDSAMNPAVYYFDEVEFFVDTNDEDIEQIYAVQGIFNTITGEVVVGWKRNKVTSTKSFDVRIADSSFHAAGGFLTHGSPAPNGTGMLPNSTFSPNGYNGMEYREVIAPAGRDFIYVAIKHEDSPTRFREIRIPFTPAGYPIIGGA